MVRPVEMDISDWNRWHHEYDDPDSELTARLRLVQKYVAALVDKRAPDPVSIVSICGGQGRELIGALESHPRRAQVGGRLVELDPDNASFAKRWAREIGMTRLQVVNGDASLSDAYAGLSGVDLVILSGVFGHIDEADLERTVSFVRELCDSGGAVVWTSYEVHPERTQMIRDLYADNEFEETAFDLTPGQTFGVVAERYIGQERPLQTGRKIFTFGSSRKRNDSGK